MARVKNYTTLFPRISSSSYMTDEANTSHSVTLMLLLNIAVRKSYQHLNTHNLPI